MTGPPAGIRLTRRAVLGGAAVGAASLVKPAAGLAGALSSDRSISSLWVGSLNGDSGELAAPRRFALAGIEWTAPKAVTIECRTRRRGSRVGPWANASILGHGPDHPARGEGMFGEPIWVGQADYVQVRTSRPVRGLRLYFISAAIPELAARDAAALPLASPVLDAGPGQPPIIAREAWAGNQAPPRFVPPEYGTVKLAFVHHTETPNGYGAGEVPAMLLSIFEYHRYVRGFWDIAYNFLIDAFGRIWEGRAGGIDEAVVGAQAGGYNQESTGVAVLGSFMNVVPSQAAIAALERLLTWKLSLHGIPAAGRVTVEVNPADAFYTPFAPGAHVSLPRIAGHRDGDSTDCPGDAFYARLPAIRPRAIALAGSPARITLSAPSTARAAGAPIPLSGRLALLSLRPLAGSPVEIQQLGGRGTTTIVKTETRPDGSWSVSISREHNAAVRALHRVSPATVSDLVQVFVAPAIELAIESSSPLRLNGTISPSKPSVTVDLYALADGRRRLLASKRVGASRGLFAVKLPVTRAGRYVALARTPADASNAAGGSSPLMVEL